MTDLLKKFLSETKAKCEQAAKKMAAIELSIHDDKDHKKEMKEYFGFNDKTLAKRKIELQNGL